MARSNFHQLWDATQCVSIVVIQVTTIDTHWNLSRVPVFGRIFFFGRLK